MPDRVVKTIKINDDLELVLFEAPDATDGSYLSLRHPYKITGHPGEVFIQPEWVKFLRDQCISESVPFFFKQWGGTNKKKAGRLLEGKIWDQYPKSYSQNQSGHAL